MELDFKYTCPIIDECISNAEDSIEQAIEQIIEELVPSIYLNTASREHKEYLRETKKRYNIKYKTFI